MGECEVVLLRSIHHLLRLVELAHISILVTVERDGESYLIASDISALDDGYLEMQRQTAIVLSGGGSKGDFEVGALRFLYDAGIRPGIVTGSSVGAINALKLAEGRDYEGDHSQSQLERIWRNLRSERDMY